MRRRPGLPVGGRHVEEPSSNPDHGQGGVLNRRGYVPRTIQVNATVEPPLRARQVHVWISRTDLLKSAVEGLGRNLSADELERAELYRFESRRTQFMVSRGLLRVILARYTGRPASELKFSLEPSGKPRLAGGGNLPRIQFNLSHSGSICAIAVTRLETVGVDVQQTRPDIDVEAVARRILTSRERAEFDRLTGSERASWFYTAWSKKEAFVKARGVGTSIPFQEVDIADFWRNRSESPFTNKDRLDFSTWWSQSFVPEVGYSGAVATLRTPSSVSYRWEAH